MATPVAGTSCRNWRPEIPTAVGDGGLVVATRAGVGVSIARTRVSATDLVDADASIVGPNAIPRRVSSVSSERRNLRCRCAAVVVTALSLPAGGDTSGDPSRLRGASSAGRSPRSRVTAFGGGLGRGQGVAQTGLLRKRNKRMVGVSAFGGRCLRFVAGVLATVRAGGGRGWSALTALDGQDDHPAGSFVLSPLRCLSSTTAMNVRRAGPRDATAPSPCWGKVPVCDPL